MARLHAATFAGAARWSEQSFAAMLADPATFVIDAPGAFVLGRVTLDEAELLTITVAPDRRRGGHGRALLAGFEAGALARGATTAFLEVAADNAAARALYSATGWSEVGRRAAYYAGIDALILRKAL